MKKRMNLKKKKHLKVRRQKKIILKDHFQISLKLETLQIKII